MGRFSPTDVQHNSALIDVSFIAKHTVSLQRGRTGAMGCSIVRKKPNNANLAPHSSYMLIHGNHETFKGTRPRLQIMLHSRVAPV